MTDFDFDCKEKKHIASNARRMKNGSKSRKCSLSTDHMTEAQWKKKNGEVTVISMNQPLTFDQFQKMPTDLQTEYIDKLITKFGCNMAALANFFGLNYKEIKKLCEELHVDTSRFGRGLRMSAEQTAAFNEWRDKAIAKLIPKTEAQQETAPIATKIEQKESHLAITMAPHPAVTEQKSAHMTLNHMSAAFAGQLNIEQIQSFLNYATGGKPAYITIQVGAMKDNG